ncbi:MAG: hypothetical protein WD120_00460 [Gemmatimonadota bacterium]
MSDQAIDWRDRFPGEVTCVRCLRVKPIEELDRLLWCEDCMERARRRAARRGWMAGAGLGLVLGLYVWLVIQPDLSLIPSAWIATLVVAFYLGGRVAREFFFGLDRLLNRRAVEAEPPRSAPGSGPSRRSEGGVE